MDAEETRLWDVVTLRLKQLDRVTDLWQRGAGSEQEVEEAQIALDLAQNALDEYRKGKKKGEVTVQPEEMRAKLLAGLDRLIEAPWFIQKLESEEDRRMLRASRDFWSSSATTADLQAMVSCYEKQP